MPGWGIRQPGDNQMARSITPEPANPRRLSRGVLWLVTRFPTFDAQRLNAEIRVIRDRTWCGSVLRIKWHFNSNPKFHSYLNG